MSYRTLLFAIIASASACALSEATPSVEATARALNPWEPIDPGFVGCEGG